MRPIHTAQLEKRRPVLVLTRELVRPHRTLVTVAPITSTIRGLSTEVAVGPPMASATKAWSAATIS
jgi:mRNA interferase MazF